MEAMQGTTWRARPRAREECPGTHKWESPTRLPAVSKKRLEDAHIVVPMLRLSDVHDAERLGTAAGTASVVITPNTETPAVQHVKGNSKAGMRVLQRILHQIQARSRLPRK